MTQITVTADAAGKSCPYCRSALEAGSLAEACDVCQTLHHQECWDDGGGCAVFGCANSPAAGAVPATQPPTPLPPVPLMASAGPAKGATAPPPPPPPPAPPVSRSTRGGLGRFLIAGALLLALAMAGVAVALAVAKKTTTTPKLPKRITVTSISTVRKNGRPHLATVTYLAPPPLSDPASNVTGTDSSGFNAGSHCSDDTASPLLGCNDSPTDVPASDYYAYGNRERQCAGYVYANHQTPCGLAESVRSTYIADGSRARIIPVTRFRRQYDFRCFTGEPRRTTGWTNCLGRAGSVTLFVNWPPR